MAPHHGFELEVPAAQLSHSKARIVGNPEIDLIRSQCRDRSPFARYCLAPLDPIRTIAAWSMTDSNASDPSMARESASVVVKSSKLGAERIPSYWHSEERNQCNSAKKR